MMNMKKLIILIIIFVCFLNCDKNPVDSNKHTIKYVVSGPRTTDIIHWYDCNEIEQSQIEMYIPLPWEIELSGFSTGDSVYLYSFSIMNQSKGINVEIYQNNVKIFGNRCEYPSIINRAEVRGIIK